MKYIRTKVGEILKVFKDNVSLYQENDGVSYYGEKTVDFETSYYFPKSQIINQADTIEELCDECVIVDNRPPKSKTLEKDFNKSFKWFNQCKIGKHDIIIYGAIWTDKGLIYVAKMKGVLPNGEIDWELL